MDKNDRYRSYLDIHRDLVRKISEFAVTTITYLILRSLEKFDNIRFSSKHVWMKLLKPNVQHFEMYKSDGRGFEQ